MENYTFSYKTEPEILDKNQFQELISDDPEIREKAFNHLIGSHRNLSMCLHEKERPLRKKILEVLNSEDFDGPGFLRKLLKLYDHLGKERMRILKETKHRKDIFSKYLFPSAIGDFIKLTFPMLRELKMEIYEMLDNPDPLVKKTAMELYGDLPEITEEDFQALLEKAISPPFRDSGLYQSVAKHAKNNPKRIMMIFEMLNMEEANQSLVLRAISELHDEKGLPLDRLTQYTEREKLGNGELLNLALIAIGNVGENASSEAKETAAKRLIELSTNEKCWIRLNVCLSLGKLGMLADLVIPILMKNLHDFDGHDYSPHDYSVIALGRFGEKAAVAVPDLIRFLEEGEEGRLGLIQKIITLGSIGPTAISALPILERLLMDCHPEDEDDYSKTLIETIDKIKR